MATQLRTTVSAFEGADAAIKFSLLLAWGAEESSSSHLRYGSRALWCLFGIALLYWFVVLHIGSVRQNIKNCPCPPADRVTTKLLEEVSDDIW
jgi:hypothetical protein